MGTDKEAVYELNAIRGEASNKPPSLSAHAKGREVLLVFDDDVGQILLESLCRDQESKIECLTRAAEIVREDMFQML